MNRPPIAIFGYNRPKHLELVLESLARNPESKECSIYFFLDGAKSEKDAELVEKCLAVFNKHKTAFSRPEVFRSSVNKGLAKSFIDGISTMLAMYDVCIILEDDNVVSPFFLDYMFSAITIYNSCKDVGCINGYAYPLKRQPRSTFFLKGADIWGFAIWRRAWDTFEHDEDKCIKNLGSIWNRFKFNYFGAINFIEMMKDSKKGLCQSWSSRLHASMYADGLYTLYPPVSFVQNIGMDGTGINCGKVNTFDVSLCNRKIKLRPQVVKDDMIKRYQIGSFLEPVFFKRFKMFVRQLLR